ncbi:MAG: cofactor-independent phosphoglycerate mutase [Ruminococcaceae bacterium]|nr:cofactor-independent phosphoglycerate mutase [Oscillospiraceae bacterium]
MKYFLLLGDGMADYPIESLGGKTILEAANKPVMDMLATKSELGLVKTVPDHLNPPGSDIANMSVMGYNPDVYYTGRSPLEAASMGITMEPTDLAFRCNIVTLSDDELYENKTMVDYSSDEITTSESTVLINYLKEHLDTDSIHYYPGISYRHCVIMNNIPDSYDMAFTPPHDITTKKVTDYLPKGEDSKVLLDMMKKSYELLKDHPINRDRIARGLNPANSVWFWGNGRKPGFDNFYDKYHIKGAVVSAVDLLKGMGLVAGMKSIDVEGATGNISTNFSGKAQASIEFLKNEGDFVYLHVEAPDECGHRNELENKIKSVEYLDSLVLEPVYKALCEMKENGECDGFRIMVLPDHPTPLCLRTHTHDAVPYMIYDSENEKDSGYTSYCEKSCKDSNVYVDKGYTLMDKFLA